MQYAFERIKSDIRARVLQGEWALGSKLPSSRDFAVFYRSSVNTVEKAIKELTSEGLLIRDSRRGTFVGTKLSAEFPPSGGSGLIAAFVVGIENPVWASALRGIDDEVHQFGYSLLSSSDEGSFEKLETMIKGLIAKRVDGLIMCPILERSTSNKNQQFIEMLAHHGIKTVFLDRYAFDIDVPYVTSDNLIGSYKLTRLLFEHGHRRILFVRNSSLSTLNERWLGFKQAHDDLGIPISDDLDMNIPTEFEDFTTEFDWYCQTLEGKMHELRFTAVYCANDQIAEAVMVSLEKMGYSIPEQVSLVTYDAANINYRRKCDLTGINQPFYEMGRAAAKQLLQIFRESQPPSVIGHICRSALYEGSSVKRIL